MSELTHTDVDTILRILDQMEGREVRLEIGELKLHVIPGSTAVVSAPQGSPPDAVAPTLPAADAAPRPRPPAEIPPGQVAVRAPTMGTFYRAGSPGARPYAEVGDRVKADDTVGVFEVMKLFKRFNDVGVTVLVATHDVHLIERFRVRRVMIEGGRVAGGDPAPALPSMQAN